MKNYANLSDNDKLKILKDLYVVKKKSFADIAEEYGTYANKIRRDAKRLNINIRDKSEAQKNALATGKHIHPTKGTKRNSATKQKIGKSVMESWDKLSDSDLASRKEKAKTNWNQLDQDTKQHRQQLAINAVRQTSKTGSKLEKFIHHQLLSLGYKVDFHKEQSLINTKLQIDLFIPSINTAIEVDGPSHFAPVWGQDTLNRNIAYDQKKEGLITGRGWHLIRIKQLNDFSPTRARLVIDKLIPILDQCAQYKTAHKFTIED
jgi:very-short-patch-repair endonuclease